MPTKIIFSLTADVVDGATSGLILGDFNNWDSTNATLLKKQKDGSMKATLTLDSGRTYKYRYLLDDGRWVNDHTADEFVYDSDFNIENCVITVPATTDDFTKIEGVGKKIGELLVTAGITTFEELAKSTSKTLRSILDTAGNKFKITDPALWPKQAKLAGAGKWPELKKLQIEIKSSK